MLPANYLHVKTSTGCSILIFVAHLKLRSYTQPWGKNNPVQTSLYPNLLTMRKETFLHKQRTELPAAINNRKITVTSRHTFKLLKCSNALNWKQES